MLTAIQLISLWVSYWLEGEKQQFDREVIRSETSKIIQKKWNPRRIRTRNG